MSSFLLRCKEHGCHDTANVYAPDEENNVLYMSYRGFIGDYIGDYYRGY